MHRMLLVVLLLLAVPLAACGAGPTAEVNDSPAEEPTPSPTAEPTATPEPTPDPAAFGELYVELTTEFNVAQCEFIDMINADPDNPVTWQEGVAGVGVAWAAMAEGLREADVPASVEAEVAALIAGIAALEASSQSIAGAPPDMGIIGQLYETEFVAIQFDQIAPAADALRSALDLPPRPENPCG